jgi:hypothetical protein
VNAVVDTCGIEAIGRSGALLLARTLAARGDCTFSQTNWRSPD